MGGDVSSASAADASGFLEGNRNEAWDGNGMVIFQCALRSDGTRLDRVYRYRKLYNDGHAFFSSFDAATGALVNVQGLPENNWDEVEDRYRRVFCCSGTLAHSVFWGERPGRCDGDFEHMPEDFSGSAP